MVATSAISNQMQFPDDWIKPGEFSFCGRCGRTESVCVGKRTALCPFCNESLRHDRKSYEAAIREQMIKQAIINANRNELARYRRDDLGLIRLFWINPWSIVDGQGHVRCQCPSESYASDKIIDFRHEEPQRQFTITNDIPWNQWEEKQ